MTYDEKVLFFYLMVLSSCEVIEMAECNCGACLQEKIINMTPEEQIEAYKQEIKRWQNIAHNETVRALRSEAERNRALEELHRIKPECSR
jgi:hypothetical protein